MLLLRAKFRKFQVWNKTFALSKRTIYSRRPMILNLGMTHQAIELYKVCINHDPGMTLTFLWQGQLRLPMHLNGKNCNNVI